MAFSTAVANARTRESISAPGAPPGSITCQPGSRFQFCESSESSSATAGVFTRAAAGWGRAARGQQRNRLIVTQARANPPGQFFDVIRFLERRHGENVAIVLFQIDFQLFGQVRQLGGILEVLLKLGLEDLVFLRFAVGQDDVFLLGGAPTAASAALLVQRGNTGAGQQNQRYHTAPYPECHVQTWCYHIGNAPREAAGGLVHACPFGRPGRCYGLVSAWMRRP